MIMGMNKWKIYIGKDPHTLPDFSIVLFPCLSSILYCGLAGILLIKGEKKSDASLLKRLLKNYHVIKNHSIKKVLEGKITPEEYLSIKAMEAFDKDIYTIKQDVSLQYMLHTDGTLEKLKNLKDQMCALAASEDNLVEENADHFLARAMEVINSRLILLKDIVWGLSEDLLKNQEKIIALSNGKCLSSIEAFARYQRINYLLNALDRLEVRGRDSSGIQIMLKCKDRKDLEHIIEKIKNDGLCKELEERMSSGDLMNRSIHISDDSLIFTYKTALITGKLGENCNKLRAFIQSDHILNLAATLNADAEMYLAHTRWASVGAINEENCHPINNFTLEPTIDRVMGLSVPVKNYPYYGKGPWLINVALNGDIDNYQELKAQQEAGVGAIDSRITTDTKVIPLQIEKYLYDGHNLKESFLKAVNDFEGSHAIAMQSNLEPGKIFLALKGSGQSIYVGVCDGYYLFSSEVYGLVEETPYFIKMDGEACSPNGKTKGQVFVLSDDKGTWLNGISAFSYDGSGIALTENRIQKAQITTRDIDRREYPHYLFKEILDAPESIKKTLRGKYRIEKNKVIFNLDEGVMPKKIINALKKSHIKDIFVVGQGTAAVAASAIAEALSTYLKGTDIAIHAKKASDLSGFYIENDMSDTMVIAVTQSGTTTDTNRAVAMARERGAHIIAIVNRRQSDITNIADGIFYTSDGRDIEMSVASTKAFYSQIVAGYVLSLFMAKLLKTISDQAIAQELLRLEQAPSIMRRVIEDRDVIRQSAWDLVRKKKYWAVVGSGKNKVASDEIRIKLSELCYKTISSDIIEDKKHIDLSSEPLILVCAAGSPEIVLEDIIKDVAIFKAHEACVVVIADQGEDRFNAVADHVVKVPKSEFPLSVILNTLAGHLWGYYAAMSLDEQASYFKDFRVKLSHVISEHEKKGFTLYESIEDKTLHKIVGEFSTGFNAWRNKGALCSLGVDTASDLTLLLKYATGKLSVEDFLEDFEDRRVSSSPIDMMDVSLKKAVDELSRPVDAIRHQAKTVTVGTSRKVEAPKGLVFDLFKEINFSLENITAKDGLSLKRMQKAISGIKGYTLYEIKGLDEDGKPIDLSTISIVKRDGIALNMKSRAEKPVPLMGTKKTIVRTGAVYAGIGRSDNASIIIIPLLGKTHVIEHLLLMHVDFNETLTVEQKKDVLGDKIGDIRNLTDEYNIPWDDRYLEELSIRFLLGEDVEVIADKIKNSLK